MEPTAETESMPQAVLRPERRLSRAWLIPLLAVILAGWLGYHSWLLRGVLITVQFEQGHGLGPGDEVRYRGIVVGQVRAIELTEDSAGIVVTAALQGQADRLARAGTRIWVVRPQFDITGVAGLETLIGPRYLALLPGEGSPRRHFIGLDCAPIVEPVDPGDLEVVLETAQRGSVRPGVPVLYRQVPVGTVLSVGLTGDGSGVESRVHIKKAYSQLIRSDTQFWSVGGLEARLGIGGVSLGFESLEALLAGGIALATPGVAGEVVRTGHRFRLAEDPPEDWLEWEPLAAIGSSFLPAGAVMPAPMRAVIGWEQGRWIKSEQSRRGWVLQTEGGLLGPADLLNPSDKVDPDSVVLEVAGRAVPLTSGPAWTDGRLALLDVRVTPVSWPASSRRFPIEPEDCLAVADPAGAVLPLTDTRLTPEGQWWQIDSAISIDPAWHGASVLARRDGMLVGMILVEKDAARVAVLPNNAAGQRFGGGSGD